MTNYECTECGATFSRQYRPGTPTTCVECYQISAVEADPDAGTCDLPDCDHPVESFDEQFPAPPGAAREAQDSHAYGLVMCDRHHVAARVLAYTRVEPPYVDIGLYQEVTYYARALAAVQFGLDPDDVVTAPQDVDDADADADADADTEDNQ